MYQILKDIFNNSLLEVVSNNFDFSDFLVLNSYSNLKEGYKEFSLEIYNRKIEDYNYIPVDFFNFDVYSFAYQLEENIEEIKNSLNLNQESINSEILDIYKYREEDLQLLIENSQERDLDLKTNVEDNINFGLEGLIGNLVLSKNLKLMNDEINTQLNYLKEERGYNHKRETNVKDFYKMLFDYSKLSLYRDYTFFNNQVEFYFNSGINLDKIDYGSLEEFVLEYF